MIDEEEEEERVRLIKVVEYLDPTMAKDLLCKFPDNSAFDFDYTQSSIWSPVAPRAFKSLPPLDIERVLHFDSNDGDEEQRKQLFCSYTMGLVSESCVSRNVKSNALNLSFISNIHKKMIKSANSAPPPASVKQRATSLKSSKGWDVVLKAASKHFKKRKKKDQIVHVKLS